MELIHGYLIIVVCVVRDFSYLDPPVKQIEQVDQSLLVLLSEMRHCKPPHHLTWNQLGPQVALNNSLNIKINSLLIILSICDL